MARILCGSLLVVLVLVSSAATLLMSPPTSDSTLVLPATPYRYAAVALPAHLTPPGRNDDNTPPDNPLSDDGATLGRVLFYDPRLSANSTTSCASCHLQAHAFADPRPFSRGFHGAQTDRRAMPLVNLRYYQRGRFFWDERAGNLEEMVLLPIQSRIEMGQDLEQLVDTLTRDGMYPALFERAFGDRRITEQRIGKALAQFVRSIVCYQSRYDEGRALARSAKDDFANLTLQENRGKALFMRNCSSCHMRDGNEHFFVQTPANTQTRADEPSVDGGVGDVTLSALDLGSFKSPSLRNVEVTAPYGHDGRFAALDAVIDHYSNNAVVDPNLGYITARPMKFTASEKAALVAFLKTLTDRRCLADARFSRPFVDSKDDAWTPVRRTVRTAAAMLKTMGAGAAEACEVVRSVAFAPEPPPLPGWPPVPPPDAVTRRFMSFDRDADRRLSLQELPERLHAVVVRGDADGDEALNPNELRELVNRALIEPPRPLSVHPRSEGLPGVIRDLKLPPPKQAQALAIVRVEKLPRLKDSAGSTLYRRMRTVLDAAEYENFVAAARRVLGSAQAIR